MKSRLIIEVNAFSFLLFFSFFFFFIFFVYFALPMTLTTTVRPDSIANRPSLMKSTKQPSMTFPGLAKRHTTGKVTPVGFFFFGVRSESYLLFSSAVTIRCLLRAHFVPSYRLSPQISALHNFSYMFSSCTPKSTSLLAIVLEVHNSPCYWGLSFPPQNCHTSFSYRPISGHFLQPDWSSIHPSYWFKF